MTHPSLEYLLVACVAAAVSYFTTPLARIAAIRWRAVAKPRDRDVHAVAIPRMGGVAIFLGFALALFVAGRLPTLHESFRAGPEFAWIVVAAGVICALGVLDDKYELDSLTKLAGQVLATGIMVTLGGVQIGQIGLPWADQSTFVLGSDLAIPVTVLFTLLTINALNFIDGLDGLAAGVTVIAATAFFAYSYHLGQGGFTDIVSPATLLTALLAGSCLGFLPHNFWPARIFMGDSGSMVLGLVLSAASTTATTSTDPQVYQKTLGSLPLLLPLLIPLSVLALPLIDLLLAVLRRVRRRRSPVRPRQGASAPPVAADGAHAAPGRTAAVLLVRARRVRRYRAVLRGQSGPRRVPVGWARGGGRAAVDRAGDTRPGQARTAPRPGASAYHGGAR